MARVENWFYLLGFMDLLAVSIVIPALPSYMKHLNASPSTIGAIGSIYGAIQFFSSPIMGRISDINDKRTVLVVSLLLSGLGYLLSAFFTESLIALALLRIIPGMFKHSQDLGRICLLQDCNSNDRTKLLGNFNALSGAAFIIGPSVHGYLMQTHGSNIGMKLSFGVCAFLFLCNSIVIIQKVIPLHKCIHKSNDSVSNSTNNTDDKHELKTMTPESKSNHRVIFLSRFLLAFSVMIFRSTMVLTILHFFPNYTSQTLGYVLSYNGFLGLVFGFLVGPISMFQLYKNKEEKLQLHASILVVLALAGLSICGHIASILFCLTLLTLGTATARVCGIALTAKYCRKGEFGEMQGMGASILAVARFASPFIGGLLMEIGFWLPNVFACLTAAVSHFIYHHYFYESACVKDKEE